MVSWRIPTEGDDERASLEVLALRTGVTHALLRRRVVEVDPPAVWAENW